MESKSKHERKPISPEVIERRRIRETILTLLDAAWRGYPGVGVPHDQILSGFASSRVRLTPQQIQSALLDLIDDGLIVASDAPGGGPLPDKTYAITGAGRDFKLAKYPWSQVDEYTGGQSLT